MSKYINKEKAMAALMRHYNWFNKKGLLDVAKLLKMCIRDIKKLPAENVVPATSGHWVFKQESTGRVRAYCSECGKWNRLSGTKQNQSRPFCSECGAVMDGKEKTNE